jgi:hypothetical protein
MLCTQNDDENKYGNNETVKLKYCHNTEISQDSLPEVDDSLTAFLTR